MADKVIVTQPQTTPSDIISFFSSPIILPQLHCPASDLQTKTLSHLPEIFPPQILLWLAPALKSCVCPKTNCSEIFPHLPKRSSPTMLCLLILLYFPLQHLAVIQCNDCLIVCVQYSFYQIAFITCLLSVFLNRL